VGVCFLGGGEGVGVEFEIFFGLSLFLPFVGFVGFPFPR
jgi:hypothetical protein